MQTYNIKLKDLDNDEEYTTTLDVSIDQIGYQIYGLQDHYARELDTDPKQIQIVLIELIDETRTNYKKAIDETRRKLIDDMYFDIITDIEQQEGIISKQYIIHQLKRIKALNK